MQKQKYFNLFCSGYADFELLALFFPAIFLSSEICFPGSFFFPVPCMKFYVTNIKQDLKGSSVQEILSMPRGLYL